MEAIHNGERHVGHKLSLVLPKGEVVQVRFGLGLYVEKLWFGLGLCGSGTRVGGSG